MFQVNPKRVVLLTATLCVLMMLELVTPVSAQLTKVRTFKQMVEESDQIVVGQCLESDCGVQDGKIVTQYKIKPSEFWKGQRALASDGSFLMTEQGGSLVGKAPLPIAQFAPGQSDMAPGEDVLLFLKDNSGGSASAASKSAAAKPSTSKLVVSQQLRDSPRIVGRWQGRFSVITHPATGSKMIARGNISVIPGSAQNEEVRQSLLKAKGMKITVDAKGAKVATKDSNVRLSAKQAQKMAMQIDEAASQARREHEMLAKQAPAAASEIYSFEPLDSVKARILKTVRETHK